MGGVEENPTRKVKEIVVADRVAERFCGWILGSHTAAFFKPFTDSPKDSGFFITPEIGSV